MIGEAPRARGKAGFPIEIRRRMSKEKTETRQPYAARNDQGNGRCNQASAQTDSWRRAGIHAGSVLCRAPSNFSKWVNPYNVTWAMKMNGGNRMARPMNFEFTKGSRSI